MGAANAKNLAIDALKYLINETLTPNQSATRPKRNSSKNYWKPPSRAITSTRSHQHRRSELIQFAKDIRTAHARGEETGFTDEEIAFYDALAENESARNAMRDPTVRVIAHEPVTVMKNNVTMDWARRDSTRANIRRHLKRLLCKYGYAPDLQDATVLNVLQKDGPFGGFGLLRMNYPHSARKPPQTGLVALPIQVPHPHAAPPKCVHDPRQSHGALGAGSLFHLQQVQQGGR